MPMLIPESNVVLVDSFVPAVDFNRVQPHGYSGSLHSWLWLQYPRRDEVERSAVTPVNA